MAAMLLDVPLGNDVILTFATPILVHQLPGRADFNARLSELVHGRENAERGTPGIRRSVIGGWQSAADLLSGTEPEWAELRQIMLDGVFRVMLLALGPNPGSKRIRAEPHISAWANVNRNGNYNVVHTHPGNHWSGVYYVKVPGSVTGQDLNGAFEFHDPRPATVGAIPTPGFEFGQKYVIAPREGLLMVFPSWHQHMVHPYHGPDERISIAFNVRLENYAVVDA